MAAPTFIGADEDPTSGDTSVASRSVTKPAGAQFAVFFMAAWQTGGGTPDPTPPSGSGQRLKQPTAGGSGETSWIYLKYVDGDATGTTYTFTFSSAKFCALKAQFWSGVQAGLTLTSATDFPGATATASSTTTYPSVAATTTVADSALSWGGNAYDYNSGTATTPAAGFTETGDTVASEMSYKVVSSAGVQTVSGATYGETTNLHALLVAIPGASAGGGFTGSAAVTQASNTSSGAGVLGYTGTVARTQAGNTAAASGTLGYTGSSSITQAGNSSSAMGVLGYSGTAGVAQANNTSSASGTVTQAGFSGSAAVTQAANTSTASGVLGYAGTVSATQQTNTSTATGKLGYTGTLARTQANNTASASGLVGSGFLGSAAAVQASNAATASGVLGYPGTAAATQAANVAAASGKLGYTGALAKTQANNISSISGLVANPVTGTAVITQADQIPTIAGVVTGLQFKGDSTPTVAGEPSVASVSGNFSSASVTARRAST